MSTTRFRIIAADHTGITVTNLERSLAFWRDVLGFELSHRAHHTGDLASEVTGVPGAEISLAVLKGYGHKIELLEYLALAVVLEFAPLGAALVAAGRSGSRDRSGRGGRAAGGRDLLRRTLGGAAPLAGPSADDVEVLTCIDVHASFSLGGVTSKLASVGLKSDNFCFVCFSFSGERPMVSGEPGSRDGS